MVEPTGYTALDLIGFTDKGPYDPTANYVKNDLVHVGNSTWRCKIDDTTGITPTEGANWTIFIESATSLAGMSDVTLTSPKNGDGLVHDGNDWTNIPIMTKEQWKKNGAYNLLPMTYTDHVINGATAIVNADGSVTIDTAGSATTGVANFVWDVPLLGKVGEKYKLVGCPSGGGANTYYVNIYDNGWSDSTKDYGSGKEITIGTGITQAVISIRSGVVIDHLTFKPMITTDLNATYADYEPHAKTNRELTLNSLKYKDVDISSTAIISESQGVYTAIVDPALPSDAKIVSVTWISSGWEADVVFIPFGFNRKFIIQSKASRTLASNRTVRVFYI